MFGLLDTHERIWLVFIICHFPKAGRKSVEECIEEMKPVPNKGHRRPIQCTANSEHWRQPACAMLEVFERSFMVDKMIAYLRERFWREGENRDGGRRHLGRSGHHGGWCSILWTEERALTLRFIHESVVRNSTRGVLPVMKHNRRMIRRALPYEQTKGSYSCHKTS